MAGTVQGGTVQAAAILITRLPWVAVSSGTTWVARNGLPFFFDAAATSVDGPAVLEAPPSASSFSSWSCAFLAQVPRSSRPIRNTAHTTRPTWQVQRM